MKPISILPLAVLLLMAVVACSSNKRTVAEADDKRPAVEIQVPQFQADSAYSYIQAQADFGPRVPNTKAIFRGNGKP